MREIKFRAYNTQTKKMFYDFDQDIKEIGIGKSIHLFVYETGLMFKSLMQYTGLKDKNGKEIYEGDIVKLFDNIKGFFEVVFVNAYVGGWVLKHKEFDNVSLGARHEKDVEIIGNIYSNPELLK